MVSFDLLHTEGPEIALFLLKSTAPEVIRQIINVLITLLLSFFNIFVFLILFLSLAHTRGQMLIPNNKNMEQQNKVRYLTSNLQLQKMKKLDI